jgi:hypothetical protein
VYRVLCPFTYPSIGPDLEVTVIEFKMLLSIVKAEVVTNFLASPSLPKLKKILILLRVGVGNVLFTQSLQVFHVCEN